MAPDKISRVLHNLLENAIRHTRPGGRIQLNAEVKEGVVHVIVEDTGEGISPEDIPHVFDRFFVDRDHAAGVASANGCRKTNNTNKKSH